MHSSLFIKSAGGLIRLSRAGTYDGPVNNLYQNGAMGITYELVVQNVRSCCIQKCVTEPSELVDFRCIEGYQQS